MQISIASQSNGVTLVDLRGKVTQRDISPFDDPLGELLGNGAYQGTVLLSLEEVEVLDSSGVSWLLTCHKRFRDAGGRLVLHSVSPIAANVFKVLNMQRVFCLAEDERSARGIAVGDKA